MLIHFPHFLCLHVKDVSLLLLRTKLAGQSVIIIIKNSRLRAADAARRATAARLRPEDYFKVRWEFLKRALVSLQDGKLLHVIQHLGQQLSLPKTHISQRVASFPTLHLVYMRHNGMNVFWHFVARTLWSPCIPQCARLSEQGCMLQENNT